MLKQKKAAIAMDNSLLVCQEEESTYWRMFTY